MQILKPLTLAMLLSFFAIAAGIAETDEAKPASKPSLTYYYFDG